jgi:16S rRNA G966 N2-methylase RsmD
MGTHRQNERHADRTRFAPLYGDALPSTRTGPLFNAFSYPTKISPEAIALFIASHTRPGDTVLDTFAGSGTTGIAARLCDAPTESMRHTATALGLPVEWGPRKAVLYEISVVGSLLARTMCSPPNPEKFAKAAKSLVDSVEAELAWIYAARDVDGRDGQVRHVIWSEVLKCPHCDAECTYWDAAVRHEPLQLRAVFACTTCNRCVEIGQCSRATTITKDAVTGKAVEQRLRVPVRIHGTTGAHKWQREVSDADRKLIRRIESYAVPAWVPTEKVFWGDLHRAGYHQGISRFHHFYSRRNLIVLSALWAAVEKQPKELREALRLLLLSFNASHSTLMTRVVVKRGQRDLVLTGAQSGVLYVSGLPVEKNIFQGVRRKIRTFSEAFRMTFDSRSEVAVVNASSTNLDLADNSIDYVFTDPPFGAFIPYAELNQINEAWLGRTTDRTSEAIVSPAQGKAVTDYQVLLKQVFTETSRVMKADALATVVFHSSKTDVWNAVADSFHDAGLEVLDTSVLDKTQVSFKQANSSTSARGDALFLLAPATKIRGSRSRKPQTNVIDTVFDRANASVDKSELRPDRIYSRYVGQCLSEGVEVGLGTADFYSLAAERQDRIAL